MILKYILKNFTRRKVRTILMILALLVSTGLIVTMSVTVETVRRSNVDLIASFAGRFDMSVTKQDTSGNPFLDIAEVTGEIFAADHQITAVYPRFEGPIEIDTGGGIAQATIIALDPEMDDIGFIDTLNGDYRLGDGQVALLENTAHTYGFEVGDSIDISYSFTVPREKGKLATIGVSERRTSQRFTISSIVRQDGVSGGGVRDGLIVDLADVQEWLDLPGQAGSVIATVDPSIYETSNAEVAALSVRDIVRVVQQRLGDEYQYRLDKANALDGAAQAFLLIQALINTYGLIAFGVVGLLVHTLVLTNVQEQRRDMAILRILGGQRRFLFTLVIAEVITIGVFGVGLGIGLGQLITQYIVIPLIENQMAEAGITSHLTPQLTLTTIIPVVLIAFVVLVISSLKPAREAARTKVMHAINPGVADNIQIEDLAQLRERHPNFKLFLAGLALMMIFGLIAGFQGMAAFGGEALQVVFIFLAFGLLVLGLGLMFFITTIPFEKLVLFLMGLFIPRLAYFAKRNVTRGETRNTLISLLVLFSGVLPSFLATQSTMENANFEATIRQRMGAPAVIQVFGFDPNSEEADRYRLKPSFLTNELAAVPGVEKSAAFTYGYPTRVSDPVNFRSAGLTVYGVEGRLADVMFTELMTFVGGGPEALSTLVEDPEAIIISEGVAQLLEVSQGDIIKVTGEGLDHVVNAHIIAIARIIPSMSGFSRSRTTAEFNSDALMSLDGFREMITELGQPLPPEDKSVLEQVKFTLEPDAVADDVADEIGERFSGQDYRLWPRFIDVEIEMNQRSQATQQIFLLVLTTISFTTAVFGVFAVIYVTIYSRRLEIGMLKALGMKRRELTGMLTAEAVTMTLGAALAGITAGASMSYITFYGQRILQQQPVTFAMDTTVVPFIVIMVVLASMLGATFSARRIVKKRAVEILRME